MKRFIITNGDSAAERIEALRIADIVLPWRDVLHDGPVLMVDTLAEQSTQRAAFIAVFADITMEDALADFQKRDHVLQTHHDFDRVELWFEHDLYDQLQLMQLLHFFETTAPERPLYLVQSENYLGEIAEADFGKLAEAAEIVTPAQRRYGAQAWDTFRASTPVALNDFVAIPTMLPHIQTALQRLQREYPDKQNGLPLSLNIALPPLLEDTKQIKELFIAMQKNEEAKFMGDLSFCRLIESILKVKTPLLTGVNPPLKMSSELDYRDFFQQTVQLSEFGKQVLSGQANHMVENGIDQWIGGVHLTSQSTYYFDNHIQQVS